MPVTLSAEDFAKKYGGQPAAPVTLSAEDFQAKYGGGPAAQVAYRKDHPPATSHGDPNAAPDAQAGPARRFLQGAGVPTSISEMQGVADHLDPVNAVLHGDFVGLAGPVGLAARDMAVNLGSGIGTQGGRAIDAAQHGETGNAIKHALGAAVPFIGPPAAEGNYAGALGSAAAMAAGPAMEKMGPTLAKSGLKTYADALAPENTPNRPLAESLGSQLASDGKVLTNPKKQLGTAFGGNQGAEAVPVEKFRKVEAQPNQLAELQKKYPDATITEDGQGNFVVNKPGTRSLNQQGADALADGITPEAKNWWKSIIFKGGAGAIGGKLGFMAGGPAGAAVGVGVAEAPFVMKEIVQSPLWRTTSGVVKTSLGKAMQAQDFATVTNVAAKVLGGVNLEDAYGHDQALFALMKSVPAGADLHQTLQDHDAIYVQPDGSHVQVPFAIQKRAYDAIAAAGGRTSSAPQGAPSAAYRRAGAEFPSAGSRDENDSMFMRRTDASGNPLQFPVPVSPSQLLPAHFKNAREVRWGAPLSGSFTENPSALGKYGQNFEHPNIETVPGSFANTAQVAKSGTSEPATYAHEVNHAVYERDLTPEQKQQFRSAVQDANKRIMAAGNGSNDISDEEIAQKIGIPQAVMRNGSGELGAHEAFAELGAQYMLNPAEFKARYPAWYGMMRQFYGGKEYARVQ